MAETIQRFRTTGSDLLRQRASARRVLAASLTDKPPRMFVKIGDGVWREAGGKVAVMDRFDGWQAGATFKVGLKKDGKIRVIETVGRENVKLLSLSNCSPGTELVWSLIKHRFPGVVFGGGYVYKETSPGVWSDHAWGTAVDATTYAQNDEVTDWVARMARAGAMNFDYALGSRDGRVVIVYHDGDIALSQASSSHEWHNHISVVDHDGRKPPRTGGVW